MNPSSPNLVNHNPNLEASVFVEERADGLAFYINGDLQFDTADEAIYHEYLVVPAVAIATQRFSDQPLRVLICGGGDGLAARDGLRFAKVADIALVDFNPDVLALARTQFAPYNQNSLVQSEDEPLGANRVTVYTQDARDFVAKLPDRCFHVVICDFTSPTRSRETEIYSREWYADLARILMPHGILAVNAVSPTDTTTAFWCIYQTLFSAGLSPKPMRIPIPSFHRHEYGDWGFFIASDCAIQTEELITLHFPEGLQVLDEQWRSCFIFESAIAQSRHAVNIHTLDSPQLFYYLLNPDASLDWLSAQMEAIDEQNIDFSTIAETGTNRVGEFDRLQLEAMARQWMATLKAEQPVPLDQLIPVQHYHHEPRMVNEWANHLKALLMQLDLKQLLIQLSDRAQDLPPRVAEELKSVVETLRSGRSITHLSTSMMELFSIVSITLLVANLATPDVAFAKGSSSSYSTGYSSGGGYYEEERFGWLGFFMMMIGGIWLAALSSQKNKDS